MKTIVTVRLNAMSENDPKRAEDVNSQESRSRKRLNRRSILKSLGAASAVGLGAQPVAAMGDTVITKSNLESVRETLDSVEEIEEPRATLVLQQGMDNYHFKRLFDSIESDFGQVQITDSTANRIDKLGMDIALFQVDVEKVGHTGEIIIPVNNPSLSKDEQYDNVDFDPGAVITGYSDDVPVEVSRYTTEASTNDGVSQTTVDLRKADNEIHVYATTCSACKLVLGSINASTCGLSSYLACGVVTSETVVGPVACATILPVVCFVITNYGTNDPNKTCAGEDVFGNKVVPSGTPTFC